MKWIEPPEKDFNLTAGQYSQPVLGLIVLRFADTRFSAQQSKLDETASTVVGRLRPSMIPVPPLVTMDVGRWASMTSPTRKRCVKRAALTLTVSAPDAKPVTRNVTLTRG